MMISSTLSTTSTSVSGSAVSIASAKAGRKYIIIQNQGDEDIYVGDDTVTTTTGIRIASGQAFEPRIALSNEFFAIAVSGTQAVVVGEGS